MFADKTELNPLVQAVVALLSTGPVGVSDRIGHSNVTLIKRSVSTVLSITGFAINVLCRVIVLNPYLSYTHI